MIGRLPTSLNIQGKEYEIRSDYRDCLVILQAYSDPDLTDMEKGAVCISILYKEPPAPEHLQEAYDKAVWFLNCGDTVQKPHTHQPTYDWEQDEQMIFSAINKVANKEIRSAEYMHFWTFIGLFNEIDGQGTFATIINIRNKKNKHKRLEKWEQEFYRNNKEIIDIKRKYTEGEKEVLSELDKLLK